MTESMRILEDRCTRCGLCIDNCASGALRRIGKSYTDNELLRILQADTVFYRVSGGGVTFSGGEPLLYPRYIGRIAEKLRVVDIPVLIETGGYFNYDEFEKYTLPYITSIYFDLKLMDVQSHKKHTQEDNTLILENFHRLTKAGITVVPRTPLIPGITDTEGNLTAIYDFLKQYALETRHIKLPYNPAASPRAAHP
jgi:pyruvate formate lyase activating enzyme